MSAFKATHRLFNSGGVQQSSSVQNLNLFDYWWMSDERNEMSLMGKFPYDIGGNMMSLKVRHNYPSYADYVEGSAFGLKWTVTGPLLAYPLYAIKGADLASAWKNEALAGIDSLPTRIGLGATAISRSHPARPQASLATTLIEAYREGIPNTLKQLANIEDEVDHFRRLYKASKKKTSVRAAKELPSKFLETEFGWKPLVADIQKTAQALMDYQSILGDLEKNSQKRIRRRYAFPATDSSTELVRDGTTPWSNPNSYILGQTGNRVITRRDQKKTWFSGEFVYSFPKGEGFGIPQKFIAGSRQLLGLDLTPETVWNVTPWTWLVDWQSNVGDVVSNFTAIGADHLVLRYGYLMQEATRTYRHEHLGVYLKNGVPLKSSRVVGETVYTAKSRIVASPFGFALTWDQLDPRQIAILTSIGITRRGRH